MNYTERKPQPRLSAHLECFWFASKDGPAGLPERVLPDGCLEWIFHLGAPFKRLNQANQWETQPPLRAKIEGKLKGQPASEEWAWKRSAL